MLSSTSIRMLGSHVSYARLVLPRWAHIRGLTPHCHQEFHVQLSGFSTLRNDGSIGTKRVWDSSCPRVWDSWEANGVNWVIRDLRPEDDEEALKILLETLCTDETLCVINNIEEDHVSMHSITEFWRGYLAHRMSLGCYEEKDGKSKLVALNVILIINEGEDRNDVIEGKAWQNTFGALKVCDDKLDPFKLLGVDKVLYGLGLVVRKEYRGAKLGSRILAAREHLACHLGVTATSTVFTGPASQLSAQRSGFSTALTVTLKELAEAGLDYPKDENRCIKVMVKKYECK